MAIKPPVPENEEQRLRVLRRSGLLDTPPEPEYDRITALACLLFRAPISMVSLVDRDRQWFKSVIGMPVRELPREHAFCAYTILDPKGLVVNDARNDERFFDNPLVVGDPGIRFYAGVPLLSAEGYALGTVCVIDTEPRSSWDDGHHSALEALSKEVMAQMLHHDSSRALAAAFMQQQRAEMRSAMRYAIQEGAAVAGNLEEAYQFVISQLCKLTGWSVGMVWSYPSKECVVWHAQGEAFEPLRETVMTWQRPSPLVSKARRQRKPLMEIYDPPDGLFNLNAHAAFPLFNNGQSEAVAEFWFRPGGEETTRVFHYVEEVLAGLEGVFERKEKEVRRQEYAIELQRINREKDHFLAVLPHELRNPMAPIMNAVELLKTENPGNAVQIIERQVKLMARLVDDLLDVSRLSQGKITLHKRRVDLCEVVRAAVDSAAAAWDTRLHSMEARYPSGPQWVEADPARIEQIVGNLLNNAVKYTPRDKQIRLSLFRKGDEVCIQVQDEGIGISPEMQKRIFERYVQSPEAKGMAQGGLGLGLDLVRQLVRLHHGRVEVFSEGVGHGSTFSIWLPLAPDARPYDSVIKPEGSSAGIDGERDPQLRVLVVEDNLDLAQTLIRLLRHWGHEVAQASRAEEALRVAEAFRPEVALVDIGLPEQDGYTVAKMFLEQPQLKEVRLIAMTGYSQPADRAKAEECGFRDYLLKPIDPALLREHLRAGRRAT